MCFSRAAFFIGVLLLCCTACGQQARREQTPKRDTDTGSISKTASQNMEGVVPKDTLSPIPPPWEKATPPVQKGAALGLYSEDPHWSYVNFLIEMKAAGVSHVAIVVPWYMKTSTADKIFQHPRFTVPMHTVKRTVGDARKQGLEIFLFPILRVEDKSDGGWRGTLRPKNEEAFWKNYLVFILRFARLAEELNIPLLSIGSELSTMDVNTPRWTTIIEEVRQVYRGKLTYSANWDHYTEVGFFDQLDYAGVTGYFELVPPGKDPDVAMLIHGWQKVQADLLNWQKQHGKGLILTEVGYLSQKNAAAWPWKEGADEEIDLELQRRCYEAVHRVWNGKKQLVGLYFWNWFGWGGSTSKEYTPRNKPAALEVKKWYQGGSVEKESLSHD